MDLGSGIRKKPIPDPGVKKAPDPGSGSATLIKSVSFCLYLSYWIWFNDTNAFPDSDQEDPISQCESMLIRIRIRNTVFSLFCFVVKGTWQ
jgi:hypothetical protein